MRKLKLVLLESMWRLSPESRLLHLAWRLREAGSWHAGPDTDNITSTVQYSTVQYSTQFSKLSKVSKVRFSYPKI